MKLTTKHCIVIVCLLLLIPVNLGFNHARAVWTQKLDDYSYLKDSRYLAEPEVAIDYSGNAALQVWNDDYVTTWTHLDVTAEGINLNHVLRTVTLPDGTISDITLDSTETAGIQSFVEDGITTFYFRTSWSWLDDHWITQNTDLATYDPVSEWFTTHGRLQSEHVYNIQSMLESSGDETFVLHNDIVTPDGLRYPIEITKSAVDETASAIKHGLINEVSTEYRWKVSSKAIQNRADPQRYQVERNLVAMMERHPQTEFYTLMHQIIQGVTYGQFFCNLILIMIAILILYRDLRQRKA